VLKGALAKELMTLNAGLYNSCVRLHPTLTIVDEPLEKGSTIPKDAIKESNDPPRFYGGTYAYPDYCCASCSAASATT